MLRRPRGTTRVINGSVLCVALAVGVAAQQPISKPERGVELLNVDFAVVGPDGRLVEDLRAEEVTIRIGGKARRVRSLHLVGSNRTDAAAVPPPFAANLTSEASRTLALVIDTDSFRPGREAALRAEVDVFLQRVDPRDRVALVTVPYGGIKVPFTTDHPRVHKALAQIVGQAPEVEDGSQLACRTRRTLETLTGYLDTLGIRSEPATILFITGGLAAPRRDAPIMKAPGMCELRRELYAEVGAAAGAARARFYVIQPGDITSGGSVQRENIAGVGFTGSDNPIEGLEHLAGVTGGEMLPLTSSADTALARVLRETASYYLAVIDPERNDRNGRTQQLQVRVTRPNVKLRARPHIAFPSPGPALGRPVEPSPREMLSAATSFHDLGLRATAYSAFDADGESMRIMTVAEPVEADVTIASLMAALFDADGKPIAHWSATSEELARRPIMGAMPVPPGSYRLRVAAIDATGRAGTVDYEVTGETARTGPLKLSSLILGLSRGGFQPRLQFTNEPSAVGYLELYGSAPGAKVAATLEIAGSLNGPALATVPLAIDAAGPNRYTARGTIPIGALPPGDYVVRAIVGLDGHPMTRVVRTLRKVR
jgi:VWFA-related protein